MLAVTNAQKCMKEMVDNTIVRIDLARDDAQQQMADWGNHAAGLLSSGDNAADVLGGAKDNIYGAALKIIVLAENGSPLLFESDSLNPTELEPSQMTQLQKNAAVWLPKSADTGFIVFAAQADLDAIVKRDIHKQIHSAAYGENEYIWVNEIINMDGGEDYAIRRIHPNLVASEGEYLSTYDEDLKGNTPYLRELNGVKEKGELFQAYYFKNKSDGKIAEKLSYAKLYEPYQWIVATGTPMNEIFSYTDELLTYDQGVRRTAILLCFLGTLVIFACGFLVVMYAQKKYRTQMETYIVTEIERDPLTGCFSRKYVQRFLEQVDSGARRAKEDCLIAVIDIDNFKKVNDTYGHDTGDIVLKNVAASITGAIRTSDYLFRWGGEEFLLICYGIAEDKQRDFAEKIISKVYGVSYEADGKSFHVTISMGGSLWGEQTDFFNVVKEADSALYKAKRSGKNKYIAYEKMEGEVN